MEPDNITGGKKLLFCFALVAITCITFFPSLNNDFTNWDDPIYISQNPLVKNFSLANTKKIFSSYVSGNYHPLTILSFNLEYKLFRLDPFPYHATNLILHCLNCLLVFWFLFLLSKNFAASFIAALLFAIHPMRVESVAWISDRKDLLAALFILTSMICYLYYRQKNSAGFYVLSLFLVVLSYLSKASILTFPFVLILCDYLVERRDMPKMLTDKIPFFLLTAVFGLIALLARSSYQHMLYEHGYTLINTFVIGLYRFIFYFSLKTILPLELGLLYPNPGLTFPPLYLTVPSFIIAAALLLIILRPGNKTRKLNFGILFFILTLLPALSIVIVGHSADRFSYIPAIGIFYLVGEYLSFSWGRDRAKIRGPILLLSAIVLIYGYLSWQQCRVWKDGVSLWSRALQNYPDYALAYNNRGDAYLYEGNYDPAISDFSRALELAEYPVVYLNRGMAYLKKWETDRAIADYSAAIRLDPSSAKAFNFRGFAYNLKNEYEKAVTDYNAALGIDPGYAEAYNNRGLAFNALGKNLEACSDLRTACELGQCSTFTFARQQGLCR